MTMRAVLLIVLLAATEVRQCFMKSIFFVIIIVFRVYLPLLSAMIYYRIIQYYLDSIFLTGLTLHTVIKGYTFSTIAHYGRTFKGPGVGILTKS